MSLTVPSGDRTPSRTTTPSQPAERPSEEHATVTVDPWLSHFRERVAAGIAIAVVVGTFTLVGVAVWQADAPETFQRVKDLLLFVNPLIGLVIGYYFHKVSTEGRAESAEAMVKDASQNAEQATEARMAAEVAADRADTKARRATATLSKLERATTERLGQRGGRLVLGGDRDPDRPEREPATTGSQPSGTRAADAELQVALAEARSVLEQYGA
jgi:hypothetical protein